MIKTLSFLFLVLTANTCSANLIFATPGNYTSFLSSLVAGDTLLLSTGTYTNNLQLTDINGTAVQPVVIMGFGNQTVIVGNACCNTVSLTRCSFLVIRNMKLDGMNQFVDAVKAEGTAGNWTHDITIEKLRIENYYADQQQVGISTKCHAWNWIIRKNIITGGGTGMYLGNSNGNNPFVNGIIENNCITGTIGYNIEVKHQLNGVRDSFPGTAVQGHTIIRRNVFSKDSTSSSGANARPNLLTGGFPTLGWGSQDYYEIYGNLFFNNPVEALYQGTGNVMLYDNIFINHYDPVGFRAVYITPQNGVSPQDVKIFHNTIWAANTSGGIRLYNPDTAYTQLCYSNAVFAALPVTNFANAIDNVTDSYLNAGNYVQSATLSLTTTDMYPLNASLTGTLTADSLFQTLTDYNLDFNGDVYDWTYRGAYSGCCVNHGWQLQLDTIPSGPDVINTVNESDVQPRCTVYPNPAKDFIHTGEKETYLLTFINDLGTIYPELSRMESGCLNVSMLPPGTYFLEMCTGKQRCFIKLLKE